MSRICFIILSVLGSQIPAIVLAFYSLSELAFSFALVGLFVGAISLAFQLYELHRLRKYPDCILSVAADGSCALYDDQIFLDSGLKMEIRKLCLQPKNVANAESTSGRDETLLIVHQKHEVVGYPLFATLNFVGKGLAGNIADMNKWTYQSEVGVLDKPLFSGW
ncbi:MAG: hypothetical protein AAGC88_01645 [Bacteroidota bacterium]